MSASAFSAVAVAAGMAKAVAEQNADNIRYFYHEGADPDARDGFGLTLLQNAANDGKLLSAATLLEVKAQVNLPSGPSGWTALHYAAYRGHSSMAELLLNAGADPNACVKGETPLHTAAFAGDLKTVMTLVKAGADVNAKDARGHTPMEIATLRSQERFQFAQTPFVETAVYLKNSMDAVELARVMAEVQQAKVNEDLAALKSRHPERFRIKPR